MNPVTTFNVLHADSYPFIQSDIILSFLKSDIKPFLPFALPQKKKKISRTSDTASTINIQSRLSQYTAYLCTLTEVTQSPENQP